MVRSLFASCHIWLVIFVLLTPKDSHSVSELRHVLLPLFLRAFAEEPVSACETACLASQKRLFCRPKQAVLENGEEAFLT